jgi:hypothetical protein
MQGKCKKKNLFLVKVWLGKAEFTDMAQLAVKMGFRRVGLPITTQKANGFADEWQANTDGISKTYKKLYKYWQETEASRLVETAEAMRVKQEAEAKLKALGH